MAGAPPGQDEFELTLFGAGYGESVVLHVGNGAWVVVDSCVDADGAPRALRYLEDLGLDPARSVALVVATHWHDDHIRGMARLLEACAGAGFCCSGALCRKEFFSVVGALERRRFPDSGFGVREIYDVFSRLHESNSHPKFALANRLVFSRRGCEIRTLSPDDSIFEDFLKSVFGLLPARSQAKPRLPTLSPNAVAVALWVTAGDVTVLLGADLEKRGWISILQSDERPAGRASAIKVPHHGSQNAWEPGVWKDMLESEPFAVLTPWRRGGRALPRPRDAERILERTPNAWATANAGPRGAAPPRRSAAVRRTLRGSGIGLRRVPLSPGAIRLRRPLNSRTPWTVEKFGTACRLADFAAP